MPSRPDTQETVRLSLELLRRIPRQRKVSATELQAQLQGVGLQRNLRTIQRQLDRLSQHFDIERDDRSKPYGYRWKEQAVGMALPVLTEQESLMLLLAQHHLSQLLPANLMAAMQGFFTQAQANLQPGRGQEGVLTGSRARLPREWLNKVRVVSTTQPLLAPKLVAGVFEVVSNALYANEWLDVVYANAAGNQTRARVMPLGLAQQGPRLYLVCRFEGYGNERSLVLHRLLSATASGVLFERPPEFDLRAYDADGRFGMGDGQWVQLTFLVTKDAGLQLLETPLSADQVVQEFDNAYRITATVVATRVLQRWLRGFGAEVWDIEMVAHSPQGDAMPPS